MLWPAPPAGVTVNLASSATNVATLGAPGVTIPAGQQTSGAVTVNAVGPGTATLTASAAGFTDGSATLTVALPAPTVSSFTPTSGRVGDSVTITGTFFFKPSAVTFNNVPVPVPVPASLTSITVAVPPGATTGPISVTTGGGSATSPGSFVVLPTQDFQFTALPHSVSIPSAGQSAFNVSLTGGGGYTGLTTLAVSGVPAGATGTFAAPALTGGQTTLLTLVTNGTTAVGSYPLTVTASGLLNGVQTTRQANITLQVQPAVQTSLTGQVLDEDAMPVKGAVVKLGTLQTTTDDAGNFFLVNPPGGTDQLMFIDGGPASSPGKSFPIIPYKVTIIAGQANTLGFTPHLHFQKTTGLVDISNSSIQRVVTDPSTPGFQMTVPAGVTITGWDGQPNTQVSIRPVPADRSPLPPFPADRYSPTLYMYAFGKQGGGTPSQPIPITFPNDLGVPPGTPVELWFYDEAPDGTRPNAWAQYGTGTVSADGSRIVPDIDPSTGKPYGQPAKADKPRFCGGGSRGALLLAMQTALNALRGGEPLAAAGTGQQGGEPVDLGTGIFTLAKTDLVLPGRLPIVFTRTYRTKGPTAGPFGPGTSHPYQVFLLVEGDLRTLVLPTGGRAAFPRQPDGTFRNTTDPAYRGAVLTQTASGHSLRFKDGATWTFGPTTFTTAFLVAQTDRNGNTVTLTRGGLAGQNVTAITEPSGRRLTLTYDANNRITAITDPIQRTVQYTYNAAGLLETVTDPAGGVTRYTYDSAGRMLTITDPRGITFLTNTYDANGRVATQTQADGGVWQFAYTVTAGVVTQTVVTDPRGNATTHRFNGQGYLLSQTDALGQTTTFTRDLATNLLLAVTDGSGHTASFQYDTAGNPTRLTDPTGATTQYTYDLTLNLPLQATNALGQTTTYAYDGTGNLTTVTNPQGQVTTFAYSPQGQLTAITDFAGRTSTFGYDAQGDLVTVTNALGVQVTNTTDLVSRVTAVTDGNGRVTQYTYDALDRPTAAVGPLGNSVAMSYDANSNLTEVVDARGNRIAFAYDGLGRLVGKTDPTGQQETFTYDLAGNLIRAVNRRGQAATLEYDGLDRLRGISLADGTSIAYTYDGAGNLVAAQDSAAGTIARTYDAVGQLLTETTPQGTVSYSYDLLGRRTQLVAGGGAPVEYQYDAQGRLAQVQQGALAVGLQSDALGRRTQLAFPNGISTTYQYDALSRLTALTHHLPAGIFQRLAFTYDGRGNRTGVSGRVAGTLLPDAVAVPAANPLNQYTAFGALAPVYDADGNLTSLTGPAGTTTFTWDLRGQLAGITGPGLTASFVYDAFGRRVSKTVNGVTSAFLYDGVDIAQETWDGVQVSYLRGLEVDDVWVRTEAGESQFYLTDEMGSTSALIDSAGTVQTQYAYGPFGETRASGPPSSSPFQFTGRETDGTGLYYFRNRYYSANLGRFISEDPVGFLGGGNFYTYAANNPCTFVDPLGLGPCGVGRFTSALSRGGRTFSAQDLNNALALVYAEATQSSRTEFTRHQILEDLNGPNDLGNVQTAIGEQDRVNEAHGIGSTLFNRLGQPGFNFDRGPNGQLRTLPVPQTLTEVGFARQGDRPQFEAAGNAQFVQALEGGAGLDCGRYVRAYEAVRQTVLNGPRFDFNAFVAVYQKKPDGKAFLRTITLGRETNFGATDFFRIPRRGQRR